LYIIFLIVSFVVVCGIQQLFRFHYH